MPFVFRNDATGIRVTLSAPPAFGPKTGLVPELGYPAELGGLLNDDIGIGSIDEGGLPRFPDLRIGGILIWLTLGDYVYDKAQLGTDEPYVGPGPFHDVEQYVSRCEMSHIGFSPSNSFDSLYIHRPTPTVRMVTQVFPINTGLYVQLWAFMAALATAEDDSVFETLSGVVALADIQVNPKPVGVGC